MSGRSDRGQHGHRARYVAACIAALGAIAATHPTALHGQQGGQTTTAIIGATIIDGNGGAPIADAALLVRGSRIVSVGPRNTVAVPKDATVINASGKFITPGFIDTNVHLSIFGNHENLAMFQDRAADIALESAQLHLKYGVTTVRDSYGQLRALVQVRDAIRAGKELGPRLLVAGNIVGWGGPFSVSFSNVRDQGLTLLQERMNDEIAQGSGEDLMDMTPEELRAAINKYLDKGPDFIKYGGTSHFWTPTFIGFSPDAQKVIVEETHKRKRFAETHATSIEGLKLALQAGIDLIQHPEYLADREMPGDLVKLILERKVICAISANNAYHGEAWQRILKNRAEIEKARAERKTDPGSGAAERSKTSAERRRERRALGLDLETTRRNAEKLIRAGAMITISSDNTVTLPPDMQRPPKPLWRQAGIASLIAIEGLVELGMSPAQAIVAATRNGAIASQLLSELGTIEPGKLANIVMLDANPLEDIRNIRRQHLVMLEGRVVDTAALPVRRVLYRD